jgi:hypothetical protein
MGSTAERNLSKTLRDVSKHGTTLHSTFWTLSARHSHPCTFLTCTGNGNSEVTLPFSCHRLMVLPKAVCLQESHHGTLYEQRKSTPAHVSSWAKCCYLDGLLHHRVAEEV